MSAARRLEAAHELRAVVVDYLTGGGRWTLAESLEDGSAAELVGSALAMEVLEEEDADDAERIIWELRRALPGRRDRAI